MPKDTRLRTKHFLLGHPSPLPGNQLPTKGEIVRYIKWLSSSKKSPTNSVFRKVAEDVSDIWINEGIPIHDLHYVVKIIKRDCYLAYRKTCKNPKKTRESYDNEFNKLFNILYFVFLVRVRPLRRLCTCYQVLWHDCEATRNQSRRYKPHSADPTDTCVTFALDPFDRFLPLSSKISDFSRSHDGVAKEVRTPNEWFSSALFSF